MKISVKTLDSSTYTLEVEPETTILNFKEILSPKIAIGKDKIRLIFKGRVLEDNYTVSSYGLGNATIHAVERLPYNPSTQQTPPSSTTNRSRRTSDGYSVGPAFVMSSVGPQDRFQDITDIMQRLLTSFQSSITDADPSSALTSRINTASQFIQHALDEYNRNYMQNSELLNYVATSLPSLNPSAHSNNQQDIINYVTQLRNLIDTFNQVQPILNLYIYFIEACLQGHLGQLSTSLMHPLLTNTSTFILHSLAHAFHSLSDVLLTVHRNNDESQQPSFSLIVPRPSQDSQVASGTTRSASVSGTRRQPVHRRSQSSERSSASQTQATDSNNNTSNMNREGVREGDDSGFHVTLRMSTDLPISTLPEVATSSIIVVGDMENPTATANSQLNASRLIRATAGSSNSSNNATSAAVPSSLTNSVQNNQSTGTSAPTSNLNPNVPVDNHLVCHSIHSNTTILSRVYHVNTARTVSNIPQPTPLRSPPSMNSQILTEQPNTLSNSNNPDQSPSTQVPASTSPKPAPVAQPSTQLKADENATSWTTLFTNSISPIIEADSLTISLPRKLPPFSDGYIAGSPNKKKKMELQQKAQKFMQTSLCDNFLDILSQNKSSPVDLAGLKNAIKNDEKLNQGYQSLIFESLRDNLSQYGTINPDKHPYCSKLQRK